MRGPRWGETRATREASALRATHFLLSNTYCRGISSLLLSGAHRVAILVSVSFHRHLSVTLTRGRALRASADLGMLRGWVAA
jgi:hypothetical protein